MTNVGPAIPTRDHRETSTATPCEACGHWSETRLRSPWPDQLRCEQCGAEHVFDVSGHLDDEGHLDGCPWCDYHTLCIQKDVNPRLGVIVVVLSFGALLLAGLTIPQLLVGLVVMTIADTLLLRWIVKRLLICYRCKAQYRGFPPGPRCRPFDLATWEAHSVPGNDS